jgi:hypothetical protein
MLDKGLLLLTKPLATFRDVTAGKFDDVVALRSFLDASPVRERAP